VSSFPPPSLWLAAREEEEALPHPPSSGSQISSTHQPRIDRSQGPALGPPAWLTDLLSAERRESKGGDGEFEWKKAAAAAAAVVVVVVVVDDDDDVDDVVVDDCVMNA